MTKATRKKLCVNEDRRRAFLLGCGSGMIYIAVIRRRRLNAKALGYNDALIRMWDRKFCRSENSFTGRAIGDVCMVLAKPYCRDFD